MLAIVDTVDSNGVPGLSTDFLVAQVSLIDNRTLLVFFTRPPLNATRPSNYNIQGASSINVVLAQYETDNRGVRLYLDSPLTATQWKISFVSGPPSYPPLD